jgi:hypothetical protein
MASNPTELKLSSRSRIKLTESELAQLKSYIESSATPYADIKANTGIIRATILSIIQKGWGENAGITKLRAFLNAISETLV